MRSLPSMVFVVLIAIVVGLLLVLAWAGLRGLLYGDLPPERGVRASDASRLLARCVGAALVLAMLGAVLLVGWVTSVD